MFLEQTSKNALTGNNNKTIPFLHIILLIKDSLQGQIHYYGNIFGNNCCTEGSLYIIFSSFYLNHTNSRFEAISLNKNV